MQTKITQKYDNYLQLLGSLVSPIMPSVYKMVKHILKILQQML